jgi:hypothetical protein
MLCALEIALTIMGIVAIYNQKLQFGKGKTLTGIPAILVGLLMTGTIPMVVGVVFAVMFAIGFANPNQPVPDSTVWEIGVHLGVLAFVAITALIVTAIFGHPEHILPNVPVGPTFADPLPPSTNWPPPATDPKNPYRRPTCGRRHQRAIAYSLLAALLPVVFVGRAGFAPRAYHCSAF